jgi:hypothetical protein
MVEFEFGGLEIRVTPARRWSKNLGIVYIPKEWDCGPTEFRLRVRNNGTEPVVLVRINRRDRTERTLRPGDVYNSSLQFGTRLQYNKREITIGGQRLRFIEC